MLKKNKALVWFIALFGFQLVCTYIVQALTNHSIRQNVELMRKQLIENGVAVSSLSPTIWTIRSVGTQVSSMFSDQIQLFAFSNTLMFFVLYRLATKERKEEQV